MEEALVYQPEYNLLRDAYLGNKEMLQSKLNYLANIAQEEQWDYHGTTDKPILYNYRIARKTAANLDAHNLVLRIKLSVGCKRYIKLPGFAWLFFFLKKLLFVKK